MITSFISSVLNDKVIIVSCFQVKEVAPSARKREARLSFAFVYPDRRGRNVIRTVSHHSLLSYENHGVPELIALVTNLHVEGYSKYYCNAMAVAGYNL